MQVVSTICVKCQTYFKHDDNNNNDNNNNNCLFFEYAIFSMNADLTYGPQFLWKLLPICRPSESLSIKKTLPALIAKRESLIYIYMLRVNH